MSESICRDRLLDGDGCLYMIIGATSAVASPAILLWRLSLLCAVSLFCGGAAFVVLGARMSKIGIASAIMSVLISGWYFYLSVRLTILIFLP